MLEVGEIAENPSHIQEEPPPSSNKSRLSKSTAEPDPKPPREATLAQTYGEMNSLRRYVLEIILMCYMFSIMITKIPQTQIFLEKACELNLHLNQSVCHHMHDQEDEPFYKAAARITKSIGLAKDIATTLPGAVASVVAGQYMTRYGAKAPLLLALIGSVATSSGDLYTFFNRGIPLYVNVLTASPEAVTGGILVCLTAIFTNVTETCPAEKRKNRFLMIQFFIFLPVLLATFLGGRLYRSYGVESLALAVYLGFGLCLLILFFFYEDSPIYAESKRDTLLQAWKHSTSLETFKRSYSYLRRKRPGHARAQIISMFCCLMVGVVAFSGAGDLDQLYVAQAFKWTPDVYGYVKSAVMLITYVLSVPSMLILTKVFRFSDPMLVAIGFASIALKSSLMSALSLGVFMYIIPSIVGLPFLVGITAMRSHLSRLLEPHEVAVVFALTTACERLTPTIADVGLTAIYNASNEFFPGLAYLVEGIVFLIPLAAACLCYRWTNSEGYPQYKELEETVDSEEQA
ncbi:uncharacterized protein LOC100897751 [Galendromus occidentalis]|uniref:Uncharacterized protein LOC100897751 n=1 Tax=Galendromus occidentalis TaxID=34638 RepID=A0AAJ6VZS9_9ACAR|nr:uncharacterized protein LOC100897751 [Galendromus occidentalis]